MPELLIKSGKHQGKRLVLPQSKVTLGRDADCQIRIGSDDVSRKHCQLTVTPAGMTAKDLGSQNGTFVNDAQIEEEVLLAPGDEIRVGPMILQIPLKKKMAKRINVRTQPGNSNNAKKASEDDILDWLSTNEAIAGVTPPENTDLGDTAVISKAELQNKNSVTNANMNSHLSVADEAAEVIKRHWEAVKKKQSEE